MPLSTVATVAGGALWAQLAERLAREVDWAALLVGALVGTVVRLTWRGLEHISPIAAGLFALIGCILGDVFSYFALNGLSLSVAISHTGPLFLVVWPEAFTPMDVLFYAGGIAIAIGLNMPNRARMARAG